MKTENTISKWIIHTCTTAKLWADFGWLVDLLRKLLFNHFAVTDDEFLLNFIFVNIDFPSRNYLLLPLW